MAKNPKTKPEDPAQSERFLKLASELEAAGELNAAEGERVMDELVRKAKRLTDDHSKSEKPQ